MRLIQLIFKKVGNHWYLDIPHDNPSDLVLDKRLERLINRLDKWDSGVVDKIYLSEQTDYINPDGLIQFKDDDLLRYFTTKDSFLMTLYIGNHKFKISSNLYTLIESKYQLDLHVSAYRFVVY
jgi:hypothetical protein